MGLRHSVCYLIECVIIVSVWHVLHRKAMSLRDAMTFARTHPSPDDKYLIWCCVCIMIHPPLRGVVCRQHHI